MTMGPRSSAVRGRIGGSDMTDLMMTALRSSKRHGVVHMAYDADIRHAGSGQGHQVFLFLAGTCSSDKKQALMWPSSSCSGTRPPERLAQCF